MPEHMARANAAKSAIRARVEHVFAHQLRREGVTVAKCTVERLMRTMGLAGVRRGKATVTTVSNPKAPCPLGKVNREFRLSRPNALWVVDFTCAHTWAGFIYVAFVIDAFSLADRGLEGQLQRHGGLCARCTGAGDPSPRAQSRGRADPSQ
jgi:transposase InsO family protein